MIEVPACVSTRADMSPCVAPPQPLSPAGSVRKTTQRTPCASPFLGERCCCVPHAGVPQLQTRETGTYAIVLWNVWWASRADLSLQSATSLLAQPRQEEM